MSIPKTGPVGTFADFGTAADANQGAEADIQPVVDGEDVRATLVTDGLRRPPDNLRQRTEAVRGILDDDFFLRDSDRAFALGGPASATWNSGTGIFTLSGDLWGVPFLTPGNAGNTPTVGQKFGFAQLQRADSTPIIQVTSLITAYAGGDRLTVTTQAGGSLTVTVTGFNIVVNIINGVSTRLQVITALNAAAVGKYLATAIAGADGDVVKTVQAKQALAGTWEGEAHVITAANLATFFGVGGNPLTDGDSVCIRYDMLIQNAGIGGRRQSIPENGNTTIPAAAIFNSRVHPEWLPNSLPIAKRLGAYLVFINGLALNNGQTASIVQNVGPHASGAGSGLTHDADGTDPISYATLGGAVMPGFVMFSNGDNDVRIEQFAAIVGGAMRSSTGEIVLGAAVTGLTASTWYYIYAFWNAGSMNIEVSTTQPDAALRLKNANNTRTYLGPIYITSSQKVKAFYRKNRTTRWVFDPADVGAGSPTNGDPITNTGNTTDNVVDFTVGGFPPHVVQGDAYVVLSAGASGDTSQIHRVAGAQENSRTLTRLTNQSPVAIDINTNAAQQFRVKNSSNGLSAAVYPLSFTD